MDILKLRLIGVAIALALGVLHVTAMTDFAMWLLDQGNSPEYVVAKLIPGILPPIAALLVVVSTNRNRSSNV